MIWTYEMNLRLIVLILEIVLNLPKTKDVAWFINVDKYSDVGTHWIALYVLNNGVTYFDSFGVEHIPKEILKIC